MSNAIRFIDSNYPGVIYTGTVEHMHGLSCEGGAPTQVSEKFTGTGILPDIPEAWKIEAAPDFWANPNGFDSVSDTEGEDRHMDMRVSGIEWETVEWKVNVFDCSRDMQALVSELAARDWTPRVSLIKFIHNGTEIHAHKFQLGFNASHEFYVAQSVDGKAWFHITIGESCDPNKDCDSSIIEVDSLEEACSGYNGHW
jgi:hypothetical protein